VALSNVIHIIAIIFVWSSAIGLRSISVCSSRMTSTLFYLKNNNAIIGNTSDEFGWIPINSAMLSTSLTRSDQGFIRNGLTIDIDPFIVS